MLDLMKSVTKKTVNVTLLCFGAKIRKVLSIPWFPRNLQFPRPLLLSSVLARN
jgi:hypothetical protein